MKTNVLVVDDSLTVRAIIEQILADDRDLRVIASASDVVAARALIRTYRPGVITLDLAMPGIDGMMFLRELGAGPHAPVIVVSSLTKEGSDATRDALASGATACFDKAQLVSHAKNFRQVLIKAMRSKRSRPPHHWHDCTASL